MIPDPYNPPLSSYPSPLAGYEGLPPLGDEKNEDGKSLKNEPAAARSPAYDAFIDPLDRGVRGGFDVHIYYSHGNAAQTAYARALWERIRRESRPASSLSLTRPVPELRIYRFWDRPIGPHPIAMFEVNLFTPAQFGAFVPWLAIWRGPLSALVHPNTTEGTDALDEIAVERRNHTQRAMWLGERVPLDLTLFDTIAQKTAEQAASGASTAGTSLDAVRSSLA